MPVTAQQGWLGSTAIPLFGSTAKQSNTTPTPFCFSRYFLSLALSHFYAHSTHFNSIWHLRKQMFSAELPLLGRSSTSQVMFASTPARPPHLGDLNLTVSACPTPSSPLFSSVPPPQAQSPINTSLLPIKDSSKPKFHLVKNNTKLVPALNHLQLPIPRLNWFHLSPSKVITSLQDEESTFYPHLNLF